MEQQWDTPHGLAGVEIQQGTGAGTLILSHGAGGGTTAPDVRAAAKVAVEAGWSVVFLTHPYRLAGRKAPAPATHLDATTIAVIERLRGQGMDEPLILGGRSMTCRVACRVADDVDATGVLCLAFPLHPPGKANDPTASRLPVLDAVTVPVLIVQGMSDPFGMPPDRAGRTVVRLAGDHSLRKDIPGLQTAVAEFLGRFQPR